MSKAFYTDTMGIQRHSSRITADVMIDAAIVGFAYEDLSPYNYGQITFLEARNIIGSAFLEVKDWAELGVIALERKPKDNI